jgi:hypothetical protein
MVHHWDCRTTHWKNLNQIDKQNQNLHLILRMMFLVRHDHHLPPHESDPDHPAGRTRTSGRSEYSSGFHMLTTNFQPDRRMCMRHRFHWRLRQNVIQKFACSLIAIVVTPKFLAAYDPVKFPKSSC